MDSHKETARGMRDREGLKYIQLPSFRIFFYVLRTELNKQKSLSPHLKRTVFNNNPCIHFRQGPIQYETCTCSGI
jgi:hypothetical protein